MHTVGRTYARERACTLADLMDYLPRSNDPGCSAGFAHGLVTGVAPSIDPAQPRGGGDGVRGCRHPLPALQLHPRARTRLHADLRRPAEPALGSAARSARGRRPTARRAPTTTTGSRSSAPTTRALPEAARSPTRARSAATQPEAFVRAVLVPRVRRQPARGDRQVDSPEHLDVLCAGLAGLQREACITARAVIGPRRPGRAARHLRAARASRRTRRAASAGRRCRTCSARRPASLRAADRPLRALRRATRAVRATAGSARRSPSSPTARSRAPAARSSRARPRRELRRRRAQRRRSARDVQLRPE